MSKTCNPFSFTSQDIAKAAAKSNDVRLRKRLVAIQALAEGSTPAQAARRAGASRSAVRAWQNLASNSGLDALLKPNTPSPKLTAKQRTALRSEIATALLTPMPRHLCARLRALDALLAGKPRADAARIGKLKIATLIAYGRRLTCFGVAALLPARSRPPPLPPGLTLADLAMVLEHEHRPAVRTRLTAIIACLNPGDPRRRNLPPTTARWVRLLNAKGLEALLQDGRKRKPPTPDAIQYIRAQLKAALERKPHWRLQLWLKAVDAAYAGQPVEQAAALANLKPHTLRTWLGRIRKRGIDPILARWERRARKHRRSLTADPALFFRLAEKHAQRPKIRKRMLALGHAAGGMPIDDIALQTGSGSDTIRRWIAIYNTEGLAPLLRLAEKRGRPPGSASHLTRANARLARP